ncbi:39S ribosomal protein L38, mitochondrial [Halotydeus destructor]|nr:39S ribosomal protein L38, mitochondrial [Halotydeus destructor]
MISVNRTSYRLLVNSINSKFSRLALQLDGEERSSLTVQKRGVRKWRRGLPFPPDYNHHHHFFLPSLADYLAEREASDNPVRLIDIGYDENAFLKKVNGRVKYEKQGQPLSRREARKQAVAKELTVQSTDDLVGLVSLEKKKKPVDYDRLQAHWGLTKEGKSAVLHLAHHYQIYRDLFSSPSQSPYNARHYPTATVPQFHPPTDQIQTDVLQKWFPGSQPLDKPEPRPIYHFTPHVPLYVEFSVPESKVSAEEDDPSMTQSKSEEGAVVSSPVFRGNIIRPLYASERPSVVIDVRGTPSDSVSSYFNEVDVNGIKLIASEKPAGYFTVAMFNLDTQLGDDKPVCHWLVTNISQANDKVTSDEIAPYMPVYGFRGFGYHRYVFVVYQHDEKLNMSKMDKFVVGDRQLDPLNLGQTEEAKPKPVGLSWFQTTWDSYSQKVMHDILNMRAPVYEYVEPERVLDEQQIHPGRTPFNVYLDLYRDTKEHNTEALLERLKTVDPFNYAKEFEVDPFPNAPYLPKDEPSWRWSSIWKQRNKFGKWRHLRPASAYRPLNNNEDLDSPWWPYPSKLDVAMRYPEIRNRPKPLRETKWSIPVHEHPTYRIDHADQLKQRDDDDKKD